MDETENPQWISRFLRGPLWYRLLFLCVIWWGDRTYCQEIGISETETGQTTWLAGETYSVERPPSAESLEPSAPALATDWESERLQVRQPTSRPGGSFDVASSGGWWRLVRKSSLDGTWLSGGGEDSLAIAELTASTTIFVPLPIFGAPVMLSPSFGVSFLDSAAGVDLPSELYRVAASFMWRKQSSERWSMLVGITPGISSDFEATEGALRIFGFGAAAYQWRPTTQLLFGAAYLGRDDITVVPMAGLVWTPSEETRLDLTFPRPRFSQRLHWLGTEMSDTEDWVFLAGELGGGTYAVEHPTGFNDTLTLRDFRLIFGLERKIPSGPTGHAEIGYVFGRRIEFEHDTTQFEPSDTVMLRVGASY